MSFTSILISDNNFDGNNVLFKKKILVFGFKIKNC